MRDQPRPHLAPQFRRAVVAARQDIFETTAQVGGDRVGPVVRHDVPPLFYRMQDRQNPVKDSVTKPGHACGMTSLAHVFTQHAPDIRHADGETRYRWGDYLAVVIQDTGEIGQFAATGPWTRPEVETALKKIGLIV